MKWLKYGFALSLLFCMSTTVVKAQLEKLAAHYKQFERQAKDRSATIRFVPEDTKLVGSSRHLFQIVLIRHGEPMLQHRGWKKRHEVIQYVKQYDSVDVYAPSFIPLTLVPNELNVIHTSSIRRAVSTAEQVFQQDQLLQSDTLFREFERKIFSFPNLKLPLRFWLLGSRALWYIGLNDRGIESRRSAKQRVQKAADVLEQDALKNRNAVLVAHGLFNHYLEKYLNKRGWKTVYNGGNGYLSQKMLVKYQP